MQVLRDLAARTPSVQLAAVLASSTPRHYTRPLVREAAGGLGLEVWEPDLVKHAELAERLRELRVDLLLNVHSLFLVHPAVVRAPTIGSFNLHPGPLPQYAGLNVPSWAIYNGEVSHGVTLHWMDAGVDSGPVVASMSFELTAADTGLSAAAMSQRLGLPLVRALVDAAASDPASIPRHDQDLSRRRYFSAGPPQAGRLDWSSSAAAITRFVRASDYRPFASPWPHPRAMLSDVDVGIAAAKATGKAAGVRPGTVRSVSDVGAEVATGDETVLVETVWVDGRYRKPVDVLHA